jgi:hypothetical protein
VKAPRILPALLLVAATGGLVWLAASGGPEVPLVPVAPGPRPPVVGDARTAPQVLAGVMDQVPERGAALRRRRNALALAHREAVAEWRAGRLPLRRVEELEELLWVARWKVGEVDAHALHRHLAELFEREHRRLKLLAARGLAGQDQVERAALYVARERHRAGLPPRGKDYETLRRAYLDAFRQRHETLVDAGLGYRQQLRLDMEELTHEFPAP